MKIDMHVHSKYSKDSTIPLEKVVQRISERELDGFALTDHDNIAGHIEAKKLAKKAGLIFIPGVEWKTNKGDILVYGVKNLPQTHDFFKSIAFFKQQRCKIAVAHPFDFIRIREAMCDYNFLKNNLINIDFLELNGRCLPVFNKFALTFAKKHRVKVIAGSDAHFLREYGRCYTTLDKEITPKAVKVSDNYASIINLIGGAITAGLKRWKLL